MSAFSTPSPKVTTLVTTSLLFTGIAAGATMPYQAIVAIDGLGISNAFYAVLLTIGSLVGVTVSVFLGWLSDRVDDRRWLIIACAIIGGSGQALVWFVREPWALVVMMCALGPFGGALYSQTMAYGRAYLESRGSTSIAFAMTIIRAVFALSWVIAPPLGGWIAATYTVFDPYAVGVLVSILCILIFAVLMVDRSTRIEHRDHAEESELRANGIALFMLVGIVGVVCLSTAVRLNGLATPLAIVTHWGGSVADVGIYASLAALIEIPFMIAWGYATKRVPLPILLAAAALIYACYVFLAGRVSNVPELLWLQGLNGIGTAGLLSLPISYVQDAIKGRVGLSTSLLDVIFISASLLTAGAFALVTTAESYLAIYPIATMAAVAGAVIVGIAYLLERRAITGAD
jgi:MFS transporter, SET family, sugar efflux transporter